MSTSLRWFCACAILTLTAWPATAQCADPDAVSENDAVQDMIGQVLAAEPVEAVPAAGPRGLQLTASPAAGATSSLAAGAEGPSVLGLALESGVVTQEDGKLTVGTSFFGLRLLFNPALWYDQPAYERAEGSRRFNFKASFGGKGEKFDRDGDGKDDEPLEAKELGDIVSWEVQYRFTKSRDRREGYNWEVFGNAISTELASAHKAFRDLVNRLQADPGFVAVRTLPVSRNGCWSKTDIKRLVSWVSEPGQAQIYSPLIRDVPAADAAVEAKLENAAAEVDKRPLLSFAAGGIERKDEFGNDVVYLALRGDKAFEAGNLKLNIEWKQIDTAAGDEPTTVIGTLEGTKLLFKGTGTKRDIEGSFAASFERFRNVPNVDDGSNAKASLKLVLPIAEGLSLPLSVTWANHKDLLDKNDEIVGHFGLAFDMSKLLELPILGGG